MNENPGQKVRLSIDCEEQERTILKILAAYYHQTLSEYVMKCVREKIAMEEKKTPNAKTRMALKQSREGKGVKKHKSVDDIFEALGL